MRAIRILFKLGLAVALALAFLAACVCWPMSTSEKARIAAAMVAVYNQPHPHGFPAAELPSVLSDRDRDHYRNGQHNPDCSFDDGAIALRYYYHRFGVDYERSFRLVHPRPEESGWTFSSETGARWRGRWLSWRDRPVTFSDTPTAQQNNF